MKYFTLLFLIFLGTSCQSNKNKAPVPRFDKKSLATHFKTKNINVLLMLDQRINKVDDEGNFNIALKNFLNNFLANYRARILITGLDGNPPYFFLSSQNDDLPSDYSSLFYRVDQLDLKKFDRRYNPNISILKSIKEIMTNFTVKNFFIPSNDFMTFVMTTRDDENYLVNMSGQKYEDKLDVDVNNLLNLTQSSWIAGQGKKQDFTFTQLRLFVAGARTPCHQTFSAAERLFFASSKINSYYAKENDMWQRQKENYNLCDLNFKAFFEGATNIIENRYEKTLQEREII